MRRKLRKKLASLTLIDLAVGVAALTAATSPASAQAPAPSWTGFYIGAHAGYRWADATFSGNPYSVELGADVYPIPGFHDSSSPSGFIGGTHLGYNWQFSPVWLVGVESDVSWGKDKSSVATSLTGVADDGDGFAFRRNTEVELTWQATIRARSGFVVDRWLWYVTSGIAFAHVKTANSWSLVHDAGDFTGSNSSAFSRTLTGWVIGGGVEHMFNPNWLIRVEYLYENFGDFNVPQGIGGQIGTVDIENVHKIRFGISYKMNP